MTDAFDCRRADQTRSLLESAWAHQQHGLWTSASRGTGSGAIVAYAITAALGTAESVGCTYLILSAVPERVGWYRDKLGFAENMHEQKRRRSEAQRHKRDPDAIPVSMRFDLRRPGERGLTALPKRGPAKAGTAAEADPAHAGTKRIVAAAAAIGSFLVYKFWLPHRRDRV